MQKITYFTPTYNRAHLLPRLYECLLSQTDKRFVWLIVDDGSTDNTGDLVGFWQNENKINIQYEYKPNGGKHTAIDYANQKCTTEYICCCDSDDLMTADATEIIYRYINEYSSDKSLLGFVGRACDFNGQLIGFHGQFIKDNWSKQSLRIGFYDMLNQSKYRGETILILKTDIIKNYHFPVFEGEKFITESVWYRQFMYDYQLVTMSELIHPIEYQQGGYTKQGKDLFFKNPKGYLYRRRQDAFCKIKKEKVSFIERLQRATMYYVCKAGLGIKEDIGAEFKITFPYNFLGNLAKLFFLPSFKSRYKDFQKRQKERSIQSD